MYKFLKTYFIIFQIFIILSCNSSSDDENNTDKNYRLTKLISSSGGSPSTLDFYYIYNSNNCSQINDGSPLNFINFYYENNILAKSYHNDRSYKYKFLNGNISEVEISYISEDLVDERYMYSYNDQNLIVEVKKYVRQNGILTLLQVSILEYDNKNNCTKKRHYNSNMEMISYDLLTYDNKNNPFKNFEPKISMERYNSLGSNVLSFKSYNSNNNLFSERSYTYEYNEDDYPLKSIAIDPNNTYPLIINYYYE